MGTLVICMAFGPWRWLLWISGQRHFADECATGFTHGAQFPGLSAQTDAPLPSVQCWPVDGDWPHGARVCDACVFEPAPEVGHIVQVWQRKWLAIVGQLFASAFWPESCFLFAQTLFFMGFVFWYGVKPCPLAGIEAQVRGQPFEKFAQSETKRSTWLVM